MGALLIVAGLIITVAGLYIHARVAQEEKRLAALQAEWATWGRSIESGTFNTALGKCALGNEHL